MDILNFDLFEIIKGSSTNFSSYFPTIIAYTAKFMNNWIAISIPLSLALFLTLAGVAERLAYVRRKERAVYYPKIEQGYEDVPAPQNELAERWKTTMGHVESSNPNDWRQAIVEADIILESLLTQLGYQGNSVAEQLKRANKGDFKSLQDAWDAHLVRNRIAHDGSAFELTQHEARRVIHLYRKVFEEFFYI